MALFRLLLVVFRLFHSIYANTEKRRHINEGREQARREMADIQRQRIEKAKKARRDAASDSPDRMRDDPFRRN